MVSYLICFQNQKALSYFQGFLFFFLIPPPLQRVLQVASRHCGLVASRAGPFILLDSCVCQTWMHCKSFISLVLLFYATAADSSDVL